MAGAEDVAFVIPRCSRAGGAGCLALGAPQAGGALGDTRQLQPRQGWSPVVRRSIFDMLEEAVGVPTPQAADPPIPSTGALASELVKDELTAYALEEKPLSASGEDFEVKSPTGEVLLRIGGGNRVPIPGVIWDKMTISLPDGGTVATLDREAFALTTTYNIFKPDGSKFGKINKAFFAFTQTFELWEENSDQPGPLLKAEGSFSERNYAFKSHDGTVVATVARLKGFSSGNVDNYQVVVGPGVDASLVLSMAAVIDEVHDEENKDNEASTEGLPDMLEDAAGLPIPRAPSSPIPSAVAPLDAELVHSTATAYELEEKALSMSGEDFDVKSPTGEMVLRVRGGNRVPIGDLPVWDKLTVSAASGSTIATLDRELVAMTPTYDVYRADGSKFGKISKAMFALGETFEFFLEGEGSAVLKASGTFSQRKFEFKSQDDTLVAVVGRGYFQAENENRYHVIVGPQVDASMVLAMAVAIDEVHDEENDDEE